MLRAILDSNVVITAAIILITLNKRHVLELGDQGRKFVLNGPGFLRK